MKTPIVLLLTALLAALTIVKAASNDEAQRSAEAWLALIDSQKYSDSWIESSSYFRGRVPQERWIAMAQGARGPLGPLASRKFVNVTFAKSLPGAPDGDYAVLQFQSAFQNKATAIETITLMKDDGKWKTAGYFIK